MPNHITNRLTVTGTKSKVKEFKNRMLIKRIDNTHTTYYLNFNDIIKQPEELEITAGTKAEPVVTNLIRKAENNPDRLKELLKQNFDVLFDLTQQEIELIKDYINNYIQYGCINWYDWRVKYWGTKWNAYSQSLIKDGVQFQTAWSTPFPAMCGLSKMFPELVFHINYADEDVGSNCGSYDLKNGELVKEHIPEQGKESREFACEILEIDPKEIEE